MQNLEKSLFNPCFSHIYVEEEALSYTNTQDILQHFKHSQIINIKHYKDVFSRTHQNYYLQKQSPSIILAVKHDNLIYKGARFCDSFGNDNFYYTSTMMNCIYNCQYCYLQGMYSSANIVIFVNIEDIFNEVEKLLDKHPVYLCISYDTDLLAFENITAYVAKWINFAKTHNDLKIELRTKSNNFKSIEQLSPCNNMILAWTLSPYKIAEKYEEKTPPLLQRLNSIKEAISKGWIVRLCFDPILYIEAWHNNYKEFIDTTFSEIDSSKILDVSIGVFRVSSEYLKIMRKQRPYSEILNYPFITCNKMSSYDSALSNELISYVYNLVKKYVPEKMIYI